MKLSMKNDRKEKMLLKYIIPYIFTFPFRQYKPDDAPQKPYNGV